MAHGDFSDLLFFMLLAVAVQFFAFPSAFLVELGPLKPQFSSSSADMDAVTKFASGLILMIALTFSGVSWNRMNGIMAGFGSFVTAAYTAYSAFRADGDAFVPHLFYAYAAVFFLGSMKVMVFPSNPVPPKTPKTKNNHGNTSDLIALSLIGCACAVLFYPEHLFQDIGPIKAQFSKQSADLSAMIKFVGCLMLQIGLTFSGVKWNPINGKMAGMGGLIAAAYTVFSTFKADSNVFVLRLFYVYAVLLFLGAIHICFFPSNPKLAKSGKKTA